MPGILKAMGKRKQLVEIYWRRLRTEGIGQALQRLAADPSCIARHGRRLAMGDSRAMSNPYAPSASRAADAALVARAVGVDAELVEQRFQEIEEDQVLLDDLAGRYGATRPDRGAAFDIGRFKVLYALVRLRRPSVVVETGVHDGLSSALILRALERNEHGSLTSIDLPSTDLPPGVGGPGWLVPDSLRARWRILLGDSRRLLAPTAAAAPIDVFIHDSDHSRSHRELEFRAVHAAMAPNGLIVSDDDEPADTLLDELAKEWGLVRHSVDLPAGSGPHIGLLAPALSSGV